MGMGSGEATELAYSDIPFMHWGIITKHNFREELARYVPRKRWDPLSSSEIVLYDEATGQAIRIGKRRGHFSYISPVRGLRPQGVGARPRDVFREIAEGADYAIFVTLDDAPSDSAFSVKPVMMDVRDYKAVTIINRFPAMVRHIDDEVEQRVRELVEDEFTRIAFGINLVTFPINYAETLSDVAYPDLVALLKSMNTAIRLSVEESMKRGVEIVPVYPFFNIGPMAGGSQPRLHSQVYIDLNHDGHGVFMENVLLAFSEHSKRGYCYLCTTRHDGRIVYENTTWVVWATLSPRRNFHLRLASKRHVQRVTDLDAAEVMGLADALIVISKALDAVGVDRNRNVLIYSNPYGYKSEFHLFIDVIPFERVGGIEILDTCRVARVAPEDVAGKLREVIKEKRITSVEE